MTDDSRGEQLGVTVAAPMDADVPDRHGAVVHVFRVEEGLGNACAIELPDGSFGIVDWGTQSSRTEERLIELLRGRQVSFIAATHQHHDHCLGIEKLLKRLLQDGVGVQSFVYPAWVPIQDNKRGAWDPLTSARIFVNQYNKRFRHATIRMSSVAVMPGNPPPIIAEGPDWEVRVLAPASDASGDAEISGLLDGEVTGNDTSMVVLFRFIGAAEERLGRALLLGDAEEQTLAESRDAVKRFPPLTLDGDVSVIPHHGSRNGLPIWFDAHLQGAVVISAPPGNPKLPAPSVLSRLVERCTDSEGRCRVYCTSYALACRSLPHVPRREPFSRRKICFGDVSLSVSHAGAVELVYSSYDETVIRQFGLCGAVPRPPAPITP